MIDCHVTPCSPSNLCILWCNIPIVSYCILIVAVYSHEISPIDCPLDQLSLAKRHLGGIRVYFRCVQTQPTSRWGCLGRPKVPSALPRLPWWLGWLKETIVTAWSLLPSSTILYHLLPSSTIFYHLLPSSTNLKK